MKLTKEIPALHRIKNRYSPELIAAVENYLSLCRLHKNGAFWPIRMFSTLNIFLWHLEAFEKNMDPSEELIKQFNFHSTLLENVSNNNFILKNSTNKELAMSFEDNVSGLFSNIWLDMTDDIYFDETFEFTCTRLKKNNIDPESFFKDKIVLDGGCGSGKFSSTIARLGAKKVYGLDIGKKGLEFAREQAKKRDYCTRIEYIEGSLLEIPLNDQEIDLVWSNGVIHHTLDYKKCVLEFNRILKKNGELFLYVNGSFGLFELLQDTLRVCNEDIPKNLFQNYIKSMGVNSGRLYWLMDCLFAPYEYKSLDEVKSILLDCGFENLVHLTRGVASDQIEQISNNLPFAKEKYGDSQIKIICTKQS